MTDYVFEDDEKHNKKRKIDCRIPYGNIRSDRVKLGWLGRNGI